MKVPVGALAILGMIVSCSGSDGAAGPAGPAGAAGPLRDETRRRRRDGGVEVGNVPFEARGGGRAPQLADAAEKGEPRIARVLAPRGRQAVERGQHGGKDQGGVRRPGQRSLAQSAGSACLGRPGLHVVAGQGGGRRGGARRRRAAARGERPHPDPDRGRPAASCPREPAGSDLWLDRSRQHSSYDGRAAGELDEHERNGGHYRQQLPASFRQHSDCFIWPCSVFP